MPADASLIPMERIEKAILFIRGEKVMLDTDLAELYGVETGALNRAVKRNTNRFPLDFMFQLTPKEAENLKCQIGISSSGYGGRRRSFPYAFSGCNDGERIPATLCRQVVDALEAHLGELDGEQRRWLRPQIRVWRTGGGFRQW